MKKSVFQLKGTIGLQKLRLFLRQFDPFLIPLAVFGNIVNRDGSGTWPIFIASEDGWSENRIKALLVSNGIKSWGWGVSVKNEWFFVVRKSQARWAEYVLLNAGAPVSGRLLNGGAVNQTANTAPQGQAQRNQGATEKRTRPSNSTSDPLDLASAGLDRILDWLP